jgi:hypothetical protein
VIEAVPKHQQEQTAVLTPEEQRAEEAVRRMVEAAYT